MKMEQIAYEQLMKLVVVVDEDTGGNRTDDAAVTDVGAM